MKIGDRISFENGDFLTIKENIVEENIVNIINNSIRYTIQHRTDMLEQAIITSMSDENLIKFKSIIEEELMERQKTKGTFGEF